MRPARRRASRRRSPDLQACVLASCVVAGALAGAGDAQAQSQAQVAVVVQGADAALTEELVTASATALSDRARVVDVSAAPVAQRLGAEPSEANLARLRVELDVDLVIVMHVDATARNRVGVRVITSSGGAPTVHDELRTRRRIANAVRAHLVATWAAHEEAVHASSQSRPPRGTDVERVAAASAGPSAPERQDAALPASPPSVATAHASSAAAAPEPASGRSDLPVESTPQGRAEAAPRASSRSESGASATAAAQAPALRAQSPGGTTPEGATAAPAASAAPPPREARVADAAHATATADADASQRSSATGAAQGSRDADARPRRVPPVAAAQVERRAEPRPARPEGSDDRGIERDRHNPVARRARVPGPAPVFFPLSDGLLFGFGVSGRVFADTLFAAASVEIAHFGSIGRIGGRWEVISLDINGQPLMVTSASLAARVFTIPLAGHASIALFAGGYAELSTNPTFGTDTFALLRLLDFLYAEARGSFGLDLNGRSTVSMGLSFGFLFGTTRTPTVVPAAELPSGELVGVEGGAP